jgi:flavin-dependent dehydrogenase
LEQEFFSMYDVAIIGAGPAGATLARLISDRYRVLLVDKRKPYVIDADDFSGKCCGGLLAPDAQGMLSKMGLGLPKSVLVDPQLFVVRAIDVPKRTERYYQRYYINMNRGRFDSWLLSMVPPNVDIRLGCRFKSYESDANGVRIKLFSDNKIHTENARILVGADGASSRIRKQAMKERPFPKAYFAIQEWVEADGQLPYFSTLFDPEITDYYCWTIPKEDFLVIGAALHPKVDIPGRFGLLKERLRDNGLGFGKVIRREAAFILRPTKLEQLSTGAGSVALLGEAGGWISPSSAEGLSYAFRTAMILADVLKESPKNLQPRFRRKIAPLKINILIKNMKSYVIYGRLLRNIVMKSGLQSMRIYNT